MANQLVLSNIVIHSRTSDNYINATQLCKAGKKKFSHWYSLELTKELIVEVKITLKANAKSDAVIPASLLVDIRKGGKLSEQGTWIHPDLAIQLAQWISPKFAIQVSRWVRELVIPGSVRIDSKKTDAELNHIYVFSMLGFLIAR